MFRIYDASGNVLKERIMTLQDIFNGKILDKLFYYDLEAVF
jgi:hypothetical protein